MVVEDDLQARLPGGGDDLLQVLERVQALEVVIVALPFRTKPLEGEGKPGQARVDRLAGQRGTCRALEPAAPRPPSAEGRPQPAGKACKTALYAAP
jgi:hypothetical protein